MTLNPPSEEKRGNRGEARASLAFTILALVQATLIFTIASIMVPLPRIAHELALGTSDVLLLQVAYGLPFSGLLLFGGRLADRYGGRRMYVLGLLVFGGACLVAALAPDFEVLVAMRFAQGVGGALTAPAAIAILRTLFLEPTAFGRAMATWGGVSVLGAVVGFVASGIVTTWISWRWMSAVPLVVSVLGLATARARMPSGRSDGAAHRPGLDPVGAVLVTAGIVVGSIGLIRSQENPWSSDAVRLPLAVSVILLVAFLAFERKVSEPLLPPAFLLSPRRIAGWVGMLLAAAGSVLIEFVLSLYLQNVRAWTSLMTAVSLLPFVVCLIVGNPISASLVARIGAPKVTIGGLVLGACGLARLAFIGSTASYVSVLLPGQILLASGVSLLFTGSAVLATSNVAEHQGGLAGGVMNTTMELGPTIGLASLMSVAATHADPVHGYARAFGAAAAVYGATALVAARIFSARRSERAA